MERNLDTRRVVGFLQPSRRSRRHAHSRSPPPQISRSCVILVLSTLQFSHSPTPIANHPIFRHPSNFDDAFVELAQYCARVCNVFKSATEGSSRMRRANSLRKQPRVCKGLLVQSIPLVIVTSNSRIELCDGLVGDPPRRGGFGDVWKREYRVKVLRKCTGSAL